MKSKEQLEALIVRHLAAWIPADLNVIGEFPTAARQDARELAEAILAQFVWQPIETAPIDDMFIWLAPKGDGKFNIGLAYRNVVGGWSDAYGDRDVTRRATLWASLPPPP